MSQVLWCRKLRVISSTKTTSTFWKVSCLASFAAFCFCHESEETSDPPHVVWHQHRCNSFAVTMHYISLTWVFSMAAAASNPCSVIIGANFSIVLCICLQLRVGDNDMQWRSGWNPLQVTIHSTNIVQKWCPFFIKKRWLMCLKADGIISSGAELRIKAQQ